MAEIRLNKQEKTIRVVNKEKSIKVVNRKEDIRLQHTGKTGPASTVEGPPGPTGVSTFVRAHHEADASFARPDAVYVEWVGSVAPDNGTTQDTWIDTI